MFFCSENAPTWYPVFAKVHEKLVDVVLVAEYIGTNENQTSSSLLERDSTRQIHKCFSVHDDSAREMYRFYHL